MSVVRIAKKPALLVRLRNTTRSEVLELEATLLAWFIDARDGKTRHFHHLEIERSKITFLPLTWTVAHFITEESPFSGLTADEGRYSLKDTEVRYESWLERPERTRTRNVGQPL